MDGYDHTDEGSMWRGFYEAAVCELNGGNDPSTPTAGECEWLVVSYIDFDESVEKKFYEPDKSSLKKMDEPSIQSNGERFWYSTYLKKNKNRNDDGTSGAKARGKAKDLMKQFHDALKISSSCKLTTRICSLLLSSTMIL
jgi:hypothetical protein